MALTVDINEFIMDIQYNLPVKCVICTLHIFAVSFIKIVMYVFGSNGFNTIQLTFFAEFFASYLFSRTGLTCYAKELYNSVGNWTYV